MNKNIYLGKSCLSSNEAEITGGFVDIHHEKYYKISHYDQMPDFFMTIVSDSDHWLFISSNGALSAGRKDRDNAMFPYYSDDKIHDYCGITGSKTIVLVEKADKTFLWEVFSKELAKLYNIERNLYKSEYGNKIIFEEINHDLGVAFHYAWSNSEKFGFVKTSTIKNLTNETVKVEILDGISNILPNGVHYHFQNEYSNLLDGYKKNELLQESGLGLFLLSAIPVDKAEPSESLSATTVWSAGLNDRKTLLTNKQLHNFKLGIPIHTETDEKACRGCYFISAELELRPQQTQDWIIVGEINQSASAVANLNQLLQTESNLFDLVHADIAKGTSNLIKIVASADGLQKSAEKLRSVRHFSNTMFNIMRGGTYLNGYTIDCNDYKKFVQQTNRSIAQQFAEMLNELPVTISYQNLVAKMQTLNNVDILRISFEYLPLTFSRRHGDPSRPWNLFSIENKNPDGSVKSDYQGNWRDIFQNWEALCLSYPGYIDNIICKFLNASTADGYNPYRISRNGIDWESPDQDDPWAYIGYWSDHQIIYLQKLLEISDQYFPGKIDQLLTQQIFAYANVPYRIKSYADILNNPQDTIEFDFDLNQEINCLVKDNGADGRLLMLQENKIIYANLTEKILVTLLTKMSNFVAEAGIWLNTQRPEWNDANNALVGNGASMVTLYYLRRFVKFWDVKFSESEVLTVDISQQVKTFFDSILGTFSENSRILEIGFNDQQRRQLTDKLGLAGEQYRNTIYGNSFSSNKEQIAVAELQQFTQLTLQYIDQSIAVNKRDDGLYHAYNLISFGKGALSIRSLYQMLEGQVALLSAGYLTLEESLSVLDSLKNSSLFRADQASYLLYPNRELARFTEKNNVPADKVNQSKLLCALIADNNTSIVSVDDSGHYHFDGNMRNADALNHALGALNDKYGQLIVEERDKLFDIYESVFDHRSYTGRSGTFFAYEGLGCIYWHMVSKLLLAVEECYFKALEEQADAEVIKQLKAHFYEIEAGLGLYKAPSHYGAFPTDAYSHTPQDAGVKQPGMTGQVKEDVISRMGCLGVRVKQGRITFDSRLLNHNEFLQTASEFEYISTTGSTNKLNLQPHQLAYTLCQIPVVYCLAEQQKIVLTFTDGNKQEILGNSVNQQISKMIFYRENKIELIEVSIK